MVHQNAFRIQFVQDCVSVALVTGSKDDDLPAFLHPLEEGNSVRADIDAHFEGISVDIDGEPEVRSGLVPFKTVNEGLIQV